MNVYDNAVLQLCVSVWQAIILSRFSGAALVADIFELRNLLGEHPEWFEVCPRVQQAHDGGFLALEVQDICELSPHWSI